MPESRRHSERLEILGDLPGAATVHQSILVKELSGRGALIQTTFPLVLNSIHDFRLALGSQTVVVKGRVVHCRVEEVDADSLVYLERPGNKPGETKFDLLKPLEVARLANQAQRASRRAA